MNILHFIYNLRTNKGGIIAFILKVWIANFHGSDLVFLWRQNVKL